MNGTWLFVLLLCSANALAQKSELSISVGVRAWYTDWGTFGYTEDANGGFALSQSIADETLVIMPIVSARYRNFIGSMSGYKSTRFSLPDDRSGTREEFDVNIGYFVMDSVALTVGYKKMSQSEGEARYRPSGPIVGISASAPLGDSWSLYGNVAIGWHKTPGGDEIQFETEYRVTEVGAAYTLIAGRMPRRWTLTAGYRMQVMTSKDASTTAGGTTVDGRDSTQGFTIGAVATF